MAGPFPASTVGWGKTTGFPFWPCKIVLPSVAPAKVQSQFATHKAADKVLVRYYGEEDSFAALSASKAFRPWKCADHEALLKSKASTKPAFQAAVAAADTEDGGSAPSSAAQDQLLAAPAASVAPAATSTEGGNGEDTALVAQSVAVPPSGSGVTGPEAESAYELNMRRNALAFVGEDSLGSRRRRASRVSKTPAALESGAATNGGDYLAGGAPADASHTKAASTARSDSDSEEQVINPSRGKRLSRLSSAGHSSIKTRINSRRADDVEDAGSKGRKSGRHASAGAPGKLVERVELHSLLHRIESGQVGAAPELPEAAFESTGLKRRRDDAVLLEEDAARTSEGRHRTTLAGAERDRNSRDGGGGSAAGSSRRPGGGKRVRISEAAGDAALFTAEADNAADDPPRRAAAAAEPRKKSARKESLGPEAAARSQLRQLESSVASRSALEVVAVLQRLHEVEVSVPLLKAVDLLGALKRLAALPPDYFPVAPSAAGAVEAAALEAASEVAAATAAAASGATGGVCEAMALDGGAPPASGDVTTAASPDQVPLPGPAIAASAKELMAHWRASLLAQRERELATAAAAAATAAEAAAAAAPPPASSAAAGDAAPAAATSSRAIAASGGHPPPQPSRAEVCRRMAALQQPESNARRGGSLVVAHTLQAAIKPAVDEAASGASLSVTVALRDTAARMCACAGVGIEAILHAAATRAPPPTAASIAAAAASSGTAAAAGAMTEAAVAAAAAAYAQRVRGLALVLHNAAAVLAHKDKRDHHHHRREEDDGDDRGSFGADSRGGASAHAVAQRLFDSDAAAAAAHGPATALLRACTGLVPALKRQVLAGMAVSKADRDANLVAGTLPAAAAVGHDADVVRQLWEPCAELCRASRALVAGL